MSEKATVQTDELLVAIQRARSDYDWPRVRDLATRILERDDLAPETAVDALRRRATAHEHLARLEDAIVDLETAAWQQQGTITRRHAATLNHLAHVNWMWSEPKETLRASGIAEKMARRMGMVDLEAESHLGLARAYVELFEYEQAARHGKLAQSLAMDCGDHLTETASYVPLLWIARLAGESAELTSGLRHDMLLSSRRLQPSPTLAHVYIVAALISDDLADKRILAEKGLQTALEISHQPWLTRARHHLAENMWNLGLYHSAHAMAAGVVQEFQKVNWPTLHFMALGTLVQCNLQLEQYEAVDDQLAEMRALFKATGSHYKERLSMLTGLAALAQGRFQEAKVHLQQAVDLAVQAKKGGHQALALAWLGAAHLACGDIDEANHCTATAVTLYETFLGPYAYVPQDVWWWHYQASAQVAGQQVPSTESPVPSDGHEAEPLADDLFEILDRARRVMFETVANINDEGLRRNYLNKVPINHDITVEWTEQAAARGESLAPFTKREIPSAAFEEQFQRLVETGNRLTAERDPLTLPQTIRNEFVELSGAERAMVALRNEAGELYWATALGIAEDQREEVAAFAGPFLEEAKLRRTPRLYESEGSVPEGGIPELQLRSVVALPLISQGRLWGVLYGDMRHIFGRFNEQDLALLNLLANQAAAALENADWVRGLEEKVEERTVELQTVNSKLAQASAEAQDAKRMAEEASEAKSSFLASMSHELRTPLNAIIGFTRIVRRKARGKLPEKQLDNLAKVLASAEHLLGLINTVLDIAKIEAGRMDVIPTEFDVQALVESCLVTAEQLVRPGVEVKAAVQADLPLAFSDQDKMRQILLNLLSNAAKFTHVGEIVVEVSIPRSDSQLIVEVTDTGIGMTEEQLGRVFEEFQQAEATTKREYGGTGLGLPISKQLAQLLGGDLTAASEHGVGSTFTLTLPLQYEQDV